VRAEIHIRLLAILTLLLTAAPARAQRLSGDVVPERYDLWFAPDFQTDTFRGRTSIEVTLDAATDAVTLHAAELAFGEVTVEAGGRTQVAAVTLDAGAETVTLAVVEAIAAGPATLRFEYTGILNDRLRGFYLSEANGRKYAVTQFEATDARRAFPSFDEPEYKAVFAVSLMVDDVDTAISNGSLLADTPGPEQGKHTLVFEPTLRMSSYLVAMLVGDFECIDGGVGGTPVRVCATPDKLPLASFALEATEQELAFFNEYFGLRYPFGKLDVIAVPDFAAGAMENTGAVTFRERLLLVDPERSSFGLRKQVAGIISHELAHMWFGDLVTMEWWDDIWLNEGFATWMANKPLAEWHPEWSVELDDARATQSAVGIDALQATRPVRVAADTPDEINEVFDGIAYEKAGAVIRMVESFVGAERFGNAIRSYVNRYAFDSAAAEDLWNELARVTGEPIDAIMQSYIDQPGVPVLHVASACVAGDTELTLTQERFSGVPGLPVGDQLWTVPVCVVDATDVGRRCEVMRGRQLTLTATGCGMTPFINASSSGYYLTEYDPDAVAAFAAEVETALSPAERVGLLGDEWWMVQAGRHDVGAFLDLAGALASDPTPAIASTLSERLSYTNAYLVPETRRPAFGTWVRERFGPELDAVGLPPSRGDTDAVESRRATLLRLVGDLGDDAAVRARARTLALAYIDDPASLSGTMVETVLRIAAIDGDAALYDRYLAQLDGLGSNPDEFYRFFNALASFTDPPLVERTLEYALSGDVRSQDASGLIGNLLSSTTSQVQAWDFTRARWDAITAKVGDTFGGVGSIVESLGSFCSMQAADEVQGFFIANPTPEVERTLGLAVERIRNCAVVQTRQRPALLTWLETG